MKNFTEKGGSLKTFYNFKDSIVSFGGKGCDTRILHPGFDIMKMKRFRWRRNLIVLERSVARIGLTTIDWTNN